MLASVSQGVGVVEGGTFPPPLSHHGVKEIKIRCSFLSGRESVYFFFQRPPHLKLVHLGGYRHVYSGIWACLLMGYKLSDLFLLPFRSLPHCPLFSFHILSAGQEEEDKYYQRQCLHFVA